MKFNRFGNMFPTQKELESPYLLSEEPFRIAGNLYSVGNKWCSSHLIDTGEGLILLDTPCASALPGLMYNITKLGFSLDDLEYLVISHAHCDHFGAVNALVHFTGAKTFLGTVDAKDMRENEERMVRMNKQLDIYNENFTPDVELEDGDVIELGNTKIRCVLTPGHTIGVMSHFWDLEEAGKTYHVGIYGGAGFASLSTETLNEAGLPLSLQKAFADSIDKVWDEPVDIMLGNHPFHNDLYKKHAAQVEGAVNPFINSEEWHRFLTELKTGYKAFMKLKPEEINAMFAHSQWLDYYPEQAKWSK